MTATRIRILIVEDSATVRGCLREALSTDPELVVAGEAENGAQAVELCLRIRPDVVTMDVVLPVMSGLTATEHIMASCPTPILVVSAAERSEAFTTYDALAAGAVDVMEKPRGDSSDEGWGRRLCSAVKLVSRIRVVTHHRARCVAPSGAVDPAHLRPAHLRPAHASATEVGTGIQVVAVGASTGGPGAIVELLRTLPPDFTVPVLLVQHISASEPFAVAFTDWLCGQVHRPVSYARGGEPVATLGGRVVMAPPDRHLVIRKGLLHLTAEVERHSCRPSVDALFESVAGEYGPAAVGCLLTGMGRDGAAGLLALRRVGGHTFAQDEASCVVYGMPREAVLLGAAVHVLPPNQIGDRLAALAATRAPTGNPWRPRF